MSSMLVRQTPDLVALVHLEFFEAVFWRVRMHVIANLAAVANDVGRLFELDAILLRPFACVREHRIVTFVDGDRIDFGTMHDAKVVRLGECRAIMDDLHFIAEMSMS